MIRLERLPLESDALRHLDVMRFVAAITVVIYHFRNQWQIGDRLGRDLHGFDGLSLAVDMFFVISGIVICFVYQDRLHYADFLKRRFARLAPLNYATFLAYAAIGLAAAAAGVAWSEADKITARCAIPHLTFTQSFGFCNQDAFNHVSWSISAEMVVYLLFPLFLALMKRSRSALLLLALAIIAALFAIGPLPPNHRPWDELTFDGGYLRAIPGFMLGMAMVAWKDVLGRMPLPRLFLLAFTIAFFGGVWLQMPRGAMLIIAYLVVVAAYAADLRQVGSYPLLRLAPLGAMTYGAYMLHPLVRTVFLPLQKAVGVPNNLAIVVNFFLVFVVAYLSYFLFETPTRKWLLARWAPPA